MVGLQAAELQMRRTRDAPCQRRSGSTGGYATALHAHFDLTQPAKLNSWLARHAGCRIDLLGCIEAERDRCILGQRSQAAQLAFADHLIAHENP